MKCCDVCKHNNLMRYAIERDTPLGKFDLCEPHSDQLIDAIKLVTSIFTMEKAPDEKAMISHVRRMRPQEITDKPNGK